MWQAPNSRAHSVAAARKRARERVKNSIHIKRVHAEVKVSEEGGAHIGDARIILNDFSPKGVGLFAGTQLAVGQSVAITLDVPVRTYIRGTVIDCHEQYESSHVISDQKFSYRIAIKFIFETAEEAMNVRKLCDIILRQHVKPKAA